jgi:hypothetical protein
MRASSRWPDKQCSNDTHMPALQVAHGSTHGPPRIHCVSSDPELAYLLSDVDHVLALEEGNQLIDAIFHQMSLGPHGGLDERGIAYDNLIDRVNLGPYLG